MKIIMKIVLILFLVACATQETFVQTENEAVEEAAEVFVYFGFDFDVDQSRVPFSDYGAAYIINISDETIAIPLLTYADSTMFAHFYYDEFGSRPIFTEMMLSRMNRRNFLILEPGDRVLAYSVAFFRGNLELYPNAIYDARIFVNNSSVDFRGFVGR